MFFGYNKTELLNFATIKGIKIFFVTQRTKFNSQITC